MDAGPDPVLSLEELRAQEVELLVIEVGGRAVAVPAATIAEILEPLPVTPLPGTPPEIEGVVRIRERVAPLCDLRRRLETPHAGGASQLLRLRTHGRGAMVVRVDRVLEIRSARLGDIAPPPAIVASSHGFVLGVLALANPTLLLDLDEVLAAEQRVALDDLVASIAREAGAQEGASPAVDGEGRD